MSDASTGTTVSADEAEQQRRGLMLVLSSPSGAGKSTIARLLLQNEDNLELSISVTTRPRSEWLRASVITTSANWPTSLE